VPPLCPLCKFLTYFYTETTDKTQSHTYKDKAKSTTFSTTIWGMRQKRLGDGIERAENRQGII
jgi:hypothetical protein